MELIKYVVTDDSTYVNFTVIYHTGMNSTKNEDLITFTLLKQHKLLCISTTVQTQTAAFLC